MSTAPLYIQIADYLRRQLVDGRFRAGQRLPTESQMGKDLSVAVGTLRKALSLLEQEGLLERRQGSGTFVRDLPDGVQYPLFHLELNHGGGTPSAELLGLNLIGSDQLAGAQHIRRKRHLDQQLAAVEDIWLATTVQISESMLQPALYQMYRESLHLWIAEVEDRISLRPAPGYVIEVLKTEKLGFVERRALDADGELIEYSHTWFNADICHYNARWT